MKYNPKIHKRRSIRLINYDYSREGLYFITICCQDHKHLFGEIRNGIMCLNVLGNIIQRIWMDTPNIRPNTRLGAFIIMPNHIHGIIEIELQVPNTNKENIHKFRSPSQTIGSIIRGFKSSTTKKIREYIKSTGVLHTPNVLHTLNAPDEDVLHTPQLEKIFDLIHPEKSIWQRNYYEHIIRNEKAFQNISNYITNNPVNWKKDKFH